MAESRLCGAEPEAVDLNMRFFSAPIAVIRTVGFQIARHAPGQL